MTTEEMRLTKEQLAELVQSYQHNFTQFQRATYNETQVRVDFVNRMFKILGWDIDNENGLPQHLREVTHEATVTVEEDGHRRSKKPDYSFRVGTETLFFLETKKPAVNITVDPAPAFQLRRYGWSGNLKISVLTNFTDLYIYDCSIRPVEGDGIGVAMVAHYHFSEYVDRFEDIYGMLSKEAVLDGRFAATFSELGGALRREPFDKYFLEQIRNWRNKLGEDILECNPYVDEATLNIFVQRILNRTIFLRICEDRSFEAYESLKAISTYQELKRLFIAADQKYDSGLFELLEEDSLVVSDSIIIEIFQSLYYPNNSYEFSVVDPYIIGQIYELFLDESLIIEDNSRISTVKKPEAIDSQGTVNTPKNITDIIVEETLQQLYVGKTPNEVSQYRIADICCGSGNFLLSAFEYIINFHIEYYLAHEREVAVRQGYIYSLPGGTNYYLSYSLKRKILEDNIFGVDYDPLAVEVTKFSLLLKVLESVSSNELDAYRQQTRNRILPNLDENIKNGNSLVNSTYAQYNNEIYNDEPLMSKIKMFDWGVEFGNRKFDAIVGNPPYIRVQNMVHYSPEEYQFYKSEYSDYLTAKAETLDKYYLFIERGLSLLNDNGVLGYIVPHKFMSIMSGKSLRKLITDGNHVKKLFHFGTNQVFENRSTYTCILVLSKHSEPQFEISFIQDWNRFLYDRYAEMQTYPAQFISAQAWSFLPQDIVNHLEQINDSCTSLSDLAEIFVGVQTSADSIYIVNAAHEDNTFVYVHDPESDSDQEIKIEKAILRKSIYDAQLRCYEKINANSYIIYPYKTVDGRTVLYSTQEMETSFPCAFSYLRHYRDRLDRRNMPNRTDENWFAFGRSQSIGRFAAGEHLIWSVLSLGANYVYDDEMVVFTGGGNGPFYGLTLKSSTRESIFYIQAILNHWLMELLVKSKASTFRGDYYSHGKQFIATLPIRKIDFENPQEVEKHDLIVSKVQNIMRLKESIRAATNATQRNVLERSVNAVTHELEALIDELYQVESREAEV